jgi:hypothetical protein
MHESVLYARSFLLWSQDIAHQRVEEMKKVPCLVYLGGGWLALNLAGL